MEWLSSAANVVLGNPTLITTGGVVMGAIVTGFWSWYVHRTDSTSAIQGQLNAGFKSIFDTLQAERRDMAEERKSWQVERKALLEEVHALRREVSDLSDHIDMLERSMREAGMVPPRFQG